VKKSCSLSADARSRAASLSIIIPDSWSWACQACRNWFAAARAELYQGSTECTRLFAGCLDGRADGRADVRAEVRADEAGASEMRRQHRQQSGRSRTRDPMGQFSESVSDPGRGKAGSRGASLEKGYSCRKASMGSRRDARNAGIMPLISPTNPRITVDAIKVPGAIISRMSPASPFLAKAL
jgi:hypothetical protein